MERGRGATSRTRSNASPTVYPDILDATSSTGLERLQAFAAQQHPDPQMSKPRPRVGELPDPQPQRGLIPCPTAAIPGRSTELGQPTGPRTADLERPLNPSGQLSTARGPQAFFRSASASMCLSTVRSATKRFNRAF